MANRKGASQKKVRSGEYRMGLSLSSAMDFDEVMRRVVRVKPEKSKKPVKRKRK
jgi:hypothetical protein